MARKIRFNAADNELKIIALSGNFPDGGKEMLLSMGVDRCLDKPIDSEHFLDIIHEVLCGYGQ